MAFTYVAQAVAFALGWQDTMRHAGMVTADNAERCYYGKLPEGLSFDTVRDTTDAYRLGWHLALRDRAADVLKIPTDQRNAD